MRKEARNVTQSERLIIHKLLANTPGSAALREQLETAMVREIDADGSLRFIIQGRELPEDYQNYVLCVSGIAEDVDKVPIVMLLFVDDAGSLFELEFVKADGSRVRQLPEYNDIRVET